MTKIRNLTLAVAAAFATFAQAAHARTPIELLFRPLMRGPIKTKAVSASNQWAGRTTLGSGSATATVSTTQINSDAIVGLAVECAVPTAYSFSGRSAIASGTSTVTASTTAVYSGDIILATWESPNAITSGQALRVDSIVNGVSFAIATSNSLTTIASGAVVMWNIRGKDPMHVKVNTISPGNFFTVGYSDGTARPISATVMWEVKRTS